MRGGRTLAGLAIGVLGCGLVLANMIAIKADTELAKLPSPRRYWEDLSIAVKLYLDRQSPPAAAPPPTTVEAASEVGRILVLRNVKLQGVRPWQFWRTVPAKPFQVAQHRFVLGRFFEDQGRAGALALGFRLLGGISPFLLSWLAVLASLPVLVWVAWELCRADRVLAAVVYCGLLGLSPYFVECLSLPHSAVGFYLIATLALTALSVYAVFGRAVSRSGLVARTLIASVIFAACALCRSGTLFFFPGFALALALGCWRRVQPAPARRAWLVLTLALLVLFVWPSWVWSPTKHHSVWADIWKGLGDFDRTRVHPNKDGEATKEVRRARVPDGPDAAFPFESDEAELYFRRSVLADIRADPAWYASILARRLFATVTQQRLWPMTWEDGRSMALSTHPNEGNADKYFRMTTTADWLGVGTSRRELRVSVLGAPFALFILVWIVAAVSGRWPALRRRVEPHLLVLAGLTAAMLGLPVLITTGGGMETEAFMLVYFAAWALGVDELVRFARERWLERKDPLVQAGG